MAKMRGARPTPRHRLAYAMPHRVKNATPAQVMVVPPFLEMWLNDTYGDCVSAEEAFAKAAYAVMNGQPETKITDTTLKAFCDKYGFLDGANLPPVMDAMIADGFQQDAVSYKDGAYTAVDWSNEAVLQNAISLGPVKIGIDADALPDTAGNANGWSAFGGTPGQFSNEDHCVSLCGYGPVTALCAALGVSVPAGAPANGYMIYTWSTIGVVDYAWLMSTCGEAWLRNPTTAGVGPTPTPSPTPSPSPTPAPPVPPIPPGPTPPSGSVTIPDQTINLGGLFAHSFTVKGGTYPVTYQSNIMALPPWILPLLKAAPAPLAPAPWNAVLGAIYASLPANAELIAAAGHSVVIALPPWLLPTLKALCAMDFLLPEPYQAVVVALCGALPAQGKCGCG